MQALLHGHSYTAYPAGCAAVVAALDMLASPQHNPNLVRRAGAAALAPLWCDAATSALSHHPAVARVVAIGTLLAVQLRAPGGRVASAGAGAPATGPAGALGGAQDAAGPAPPPAPASPPAPAITAYASSAGGAVAVATLLRDAHGVFARPLGDVVYLMVAPTTRRAVCDGLMASVRAALDAHVECAGRGGGGRSGRGDGYVV